ncbi:MAG: hypothetical protein ABIJ41_00080 [Candidatus Omnitrophota bacterium]
MTKKSENQIIDGKIFAILSYISILCIIPLVLKKENDFVLSHGKQGLVIFIAQVGLFIASIVFPWLLKPGFFVLGVLSLWGIIEVLRGNYIELPVVFGIAKKITL